MMVVFCTVYSPLCARPLREPTNPEDINQETILPYLLPEKHPLRKILAEIFVDPNMFQSYEQFVNAGFEVKRGSKRLLVGRHPSIPDYLFKKYYGQSQTSQLYNYIQRIEGANFLRQYIKEHDFKHLTVPKKWLYELPSNFSERRSEKTYLLIVERMDLITDHYSEGKILYYNMDADMLTELCTILHEVKCDAFPTRNLPMTHSGKIAFVDTETVRKGKSNFIKRFVPLLNPEMQTYALALWEKLEEKDNQLSLR